VGKYQVLIKPGVEEKMITVTVANCTVIQIVKARKPVFQGGRNGLPREIILAVMICFALGMVTGIYETLDTMALTSPRVKG
jgi:ABC-type enterobactin transport system permease subunit